MSATSWASKIVLNCGKPTKKSNPCWCSSSTAWARAKPIYEAFKAIRAGADWDNLDPAQQRIVESSIREAELSGVGLEGEAKERFNEIQQALAELSTKFSNNVLDATKGFSLTLTDPQEVEGLPPSLLALAAQAARE